MKMEGVEGEFNGFDIRIAGEEDFDLLFEHLRNNFFRDDPLNQLIGFSDSYVTVVANLWWSKVLEKFSLIAFDRATGKVAGCRITSEERKGHENPSPKIPIETPEGQKKSLVLGSINGMVNMFEKYGIDRYADSCLVSVDRDFRQRGLAMELYNRSLTLLRAKGFTHLKIVFTSGFSRRNAEKLGFVELVRKRFLDFLDENGQQVLPNAEPDDVCTLAVLIL